jgi:hypothetical protein
MSPLYPGRVERALAERWGEIEKSQKSAKADLSLMDQALQAFMAMSVEEVEARVAQWCTAEEKVCAGARPTSEQDNRPFIETFGSDWRHHQDARSWAAEVLRGVTTFAADGSQIPPNRDMSVSAGLVQVGWFENKHDERGSYIKDAEVHVLPLTGIASPDEDEDDADSEEGAKGRIQSMEQEIAWVRFGVEVDKAIAFLEKSAGQDRALAFFDGSLILSFVHNLHEHRQRQYIRKIRQLLDASAATRVPVIGYIDSSHSADFTHLLKVVNNIKRRLRVEDASLLRAKMKWGDRCRMFVCDRDDAVVDNSYYGDVLFTYLKTAENATPARVEMPRWVFEAGLHDWVLDVVRAECVVGVGYPYPLETADAVAVLSMQDRERFYRLFQEYARRNSQLTVRFSRKSLSKRGRRM